MQKKSNEHLQLDVPDLTLNHSKQSDVSKTWNDEPDSVIKEHISGTNWSIPDIIASQIKHVDSPEFVHSSKNDEKNPELYIPASGMDKNELLPGEVYHVVLDKKGGSLGLNIFVSCCSECSLYSFVNN